MENLNKKQKIILGIIIAIVVVTIFYYVYVVKEKETESILTIDEIISVDDNSNNDIENNNINNEDTEENFSDDIIMIHVAGAVNNEGIYELKANSRVADAIDKAGGLKENAYIDKINLAYILEDGMKIYIPNINEKDLENGLSNDSTGNYITKGNRTDSDSSADVSKNKTDAQKININTATQTELETLPGIGTSTALKIINYRNENGKFAKIEDIKNVSGIGDSKYTQIKGLICI